jgi:hypothetical protein
MNRKFNAAFLLLAGVVVSLTAFAQTTICFHSVNNSGEVS